MAEAAQVPVPVWPGPTLRTTMRVAVLVVVAERTAALAEQAVPIHRRTNLEMACAAAAPVLAVVAAGSARAA